MATYFLSFLSSVLYSSLLHVLFDCMGLREQGTSTETPWREIGIH